MRSASSSLLTLLGAVCFAGASAPAQTQEAAPPPLLLGAESALGEGAKHECSGIVQSRARAGVFWTLGDSGNKARIYAVRADGTLVAPRERSQGTRIDGAFNIDWEDIALDASGRVVVADLGNNANARPELTFYLIQEPPPDAERAELVSKFMVRYPDQPSVPAPKNNRNFDCEAVFTVGDDIFVLSKDRSDTFTKLYRVDGRDPGKFNPLTYIDRFDVQGRATAADASTDGLRLAVLTYDAVWIFERDDVRSSFFSGRVRSRAYRYASGESSSEAICFESPETLLIGDETRAALSRVRTADIPLVRAASVPAHETAADELTVMSFNIRYAGADDGENSWSARRDLVAAAVRASAPDLLGMQEVEAVQADWLREQLPEFAFHGVGRADGARAGEFAPIFYRASRFELLDAGHFWISETPEVPGSKGWDAACERMASWVRLKDRATGATLVVLNTHLDHVGVEARANGLALIRARLDTMCAGAQVIVTGDFNTSADADPAPRLRAAPGSALILADTFRRAFPTKDTDEATFNNWKPAIYGDRIDWILASDGLETLDASIDRRAPHGHNPSDHWPITARLRLLAVPRPAP